MKGHLIKALGAEPELSSQLAILAHQLWNSAANCASSRRSIDDQGQPSSPTSPSRQAASGEGSHLATPNQPQSRTSAIGTGDYHPIYDQFTGQSPPTTSDGAGEPSKTTDQAPHFSNTTNLGQDPPDSAKGFGPSSTQANPSSTLHPDTMANRPGMTDDMSTASIKSGVLGFPQGGEQQHAALQNNPSEHGLDTTQAQGTRDLPDRSTG